MLRDVVRRPARITVNYRHGARTKEAIQLVRLVNLLSRLSGSFEKGELSGTVVSQRLDRPRSSIARAGSRPRAGNFIASVY
jgi:hypothetical protein